MLNHICLTVFSIDLGIQFNIQFTRVLRQTKLPKGNTALLKRLQGYTVNRQKKFPPKSSNTPPLPRDRGNRRIIFLAVDKTSKLYSLMKRLPLKDY